VCRRIIRAVSHKVGSRKTGCSQRLRSNRGTRTSRSYSRVSRLSHRFSSSPVHSRSLSCSSARWSSHAHNHSRSSGSRCSRNRKCSGNNRSRRLALRISRVRNRTIVLAKNARANGGLRVSQGRPALQRVGLVVS